MVFTTEGFSEVGFEPRTTDFRSYALTNWAIRPWVQLAVRANLVQLLQFHLFVQCSRFISAFAFVSRHICFKLSLAKVITLQRCSCTDVSFNNYFQCLHSTDLRLDHSLIFQFFSKTIRQKTWHLELKLGKFYSYTHIYWIYKEQRHIQNPSSHCTKKIKVFR